MKQVENILKILEKHYHKSYNYKNGWCPFIKIRLISKMVKYHHGVLLKSLYINEKRRKRTLKCSNFASVKSVWAHAKPIYINGFR